MPHKLIVASPSPTAPSIDVPDEHLLTAIELGHRVVRDSARARAAAARAATQLPDTMVARHDNQRRRRVPVHAPRAPYRSISSADGLFRWLALEELETEEREQESQPGFQLGDDDWLLRLVKNQAQTLLYANSFYAAIEVGQFWCDYPSKILLDVYDRVADERSDGKDPYACSRAKRTLLGAALERFPGRIELARKGNQWRLRSTPASDRQLETVFNGFELFMPVPPPAPWPGDMASIDQTRESGVEMARMRRFLNPEAFEAVADAVSTGRRQPPIERIRDCLQVPVFNNVPTKQGPPDPETGDLLSDLDVVRGLIDRQRGRRARVRPETLRLEVDRIDCGALDTIRDLVLDARAAVLRVVGIDSDGERIVVATFVRMYGLAGVWDWDVSLPGGQCTRLTISVGEDDATTVNVVSVPAPDIQCVFAPERIVQSRRPGTIVYRIAIGGQEIRELRRAIEGLRDIHLHTGDTAHFVLGEMGTGKSTVLSRHLSAFSRAEYPVILDECDDRIPADCCKQIRSRLDEWRNDGVQRLDRAVERQVTIYDRFKRAAPDIEPWESHAVLDTGRGRLLQYLPTAMPLVATGIGAMVLVSQFAPWSTPMRIFAATWWPVAAALAVVMDIALVRYLQRRDEPRRLAERFQRIERQAELLRTNVVLIDAFAEAPRRWQRLRAARLVLAMSRSRLVRTGSIAELMDALRELGVGDDAGALAEAVVRARSCRYPLVSALANVLAHEESHMASACRSPDVADDAP